MRGMLLRLALAICVCSAAHAEALSPRAFTDAVVRLLSSKGAADAITVTGDLSLAIKRKGGDAVVSLANPYDDYKRDPSRFEAIVSPYVAALAAPPQQAKLDRSRIVPVIKDRQWVADIRA